MCTQVSVTTQEQDRDSLTPSAFPETSNEPVTKGRPQGPSGGQSSHVLYFQTPRIRRGMEGYESPWVVWDLRLRRRVVWRNEPTRTLDKQPQLSHYSFDSGPSLPSPDHSTLRDSSGTPVPTRRTVPPLRPGPTPRREERRDLPGCKDPPLTRPPPPLRPNARRGRHSRRPGPRSWTRTDTDPVTETTRDPDQVPTYPPRVRRKITTRPPSVYEVTRTPTVPPGPNRGHRGFGDRGVRTIVGHLR